MGADLKVGDLVTIIQHGEHDESVRKNYGKILKIKKIIDTGDFLLYKVGNVKGYALSDDLKKITL